MTDPRTSIFWQTVARSGLIDAESLTACWEAIPAEKRTPDAIDRRLARQAVNAGHITLWQAQQILAGRPQGLKIDRYVLQDLLGQGGMGRVYLARDSRLRRPVALKILSRDRMNNPRALARFRREARVGAQLQHENLIRVYDEGEYQGVRYLVMEYITGRTVGQMILQQGRLPYPLAAELTRQVALGLEHLHQKGLLHRDVNPMNILIDRDGTAKLTDLGLAIDPGDEEEEVVTRDGATVGTFDYISPEQARHSRNIDIRSDIYSLGCTLYHMISGRAPFPAPSLPEKLFAHQSGEAEPLTALVPGVPEGLDAVVRRMMSKRPEDRYARPRDLARALEEFRAAPEDVETPPRPLLAEPRAGAAGDPEATVIEPPVPPPQGSDPDLVSPPSGASASGPAVEERPPFVAPEPASSGSDDPLRIDLGPPPPLSEIRSGSRSRDDDEGPDPRRWLVPALVAAALLLGAAGAYLSGLLSGPGAAGLPETGGGPGDERGKAGPVPPPGGDPALNAPGLTVEFDDGEIRRPIDLADAISQAIGKPAAVVLRNSEPLTLALDRPIAVKQGDLRLRAAPGTAPVAAVELKGEGGLLEVGPNARLEISGLSFMVRRTAGPPGGLIDAHGRVELERVAFAAGPGARTDRALRAAGPRTDLRGCWFEGFERPVELATLPGSEATLTQCMIVLAGDAAPMAWAVTAKPEVTGARPARLVFDHCSVVGAGLLAGSGFGAESPLEVEVDSAIVAARSLLMWDKPFPPVALKFTGRDNLYRITGAAWVVRPPEGFNAAEGSPSNLESWATGPIREEGSEVRNIRFVGEPIVPGGASPLGLRPADFDGEPPGADPAQVGPERPAVAPVE